MTKKEYIGFPRNAEERQLSALPMDVLLDYADAIMADPERLKWLKIGWDKNATAAWTDDQHGDLAWIEQKFGDAFLVNAGYEGLYNRHVWALIKVDKAIFKYIQSPKGDVRDFVQEQLANSRYVKENYSTGENS